MPAALGVRVTWSTRRRRLLDFVDDESSKRSSSACATWAHFRLGGDRHGVDAHRGPASSTDLESTSGCRRRRAVRDRAARRHLRARLEDAGLRPTARGRLEGQRGYQTSVAAHFRGGRRHRLPRLAATGMEQGRVAGSIAVRVEPPPMPELLPYGIYTIPEITWSADRALPDRGGAPYVAGLARYRELARGAIADDRTACSSSVPRRLPPAARRPRDRHRRDRGDPHRPDRHGRGPPSTTSSTPSSTTPPRRRLQGLRPRRRQPAQPARDPDRGFEPPPCRRRLDLVFEGNWGGERVARRARPISQTYCRLCRASRCLGPPRCSPTADAGGSARGRAAPDWSHR